MRRYEISDDRWDRIKLLLPGQPGDPGVTASDNRSFLNAALWIARSGAPWRDPPERLGNWSRWPRQPGRVSIERRPRGGHRMRGRIN